MAQGYIYKFTLETKEKKKQAGEEKLREFESQKQDIINIFKVSKLLSEAKSIFITKYCIYGNNFYLARILFIFRYY